MAIWKVTVAWKALLSRVWLLKGGLVRSYVRDLGGRDGREGFREELRNGKTFPRTTIKGMLGLGRGNESMRVS